MIVGVAANQSCYYTQLLQEVAECEPLRYLYMCLRMRTCTNRDQWDSVEQAKEG